MNNPANIVAVTPALARGWLRNSVSPQDHIVLGRLNRYIADMMNGRWRKPGDDTQPITLRPGGKLQNGHHRLLALLVADVVLDFPVRLKP